MFQINNNEEVGVKEKGKKAKAPELIGMMQTTGGLNRELASVKHLRI